jgi:hypothetical protein
MKYLCLVHIDGEAIGKLNEAEGKDLDRRSIEYDKGLERRGVYITSDALQGPETAKIVRARGGKVSTTDGPYAETKEHLGGFILIDASGMDEAVEIAAKIPVGQYGTIEVRPIMQIDPDRK